MSRRASTSDSSPDATDIHHVQGSGFAWKARWKDHRRERAERIRSLTETLPEDILEVVLQQTLADLLHQHNACNIRDLLMVCKRWFFLGYPYLMYRLRVRYPHDVFALSPRSLPLVRVLAVDECHGSEDPPWLHHLLFSSTPRSMLSLTSLERVLHGIDSQSYAKRLPPYFAPLLPSLMGHTFSNIRFFAITDYHFRDWLEFAKSVLSLPSLETLQIHRISWEKTVETIPSWLRSYGRLRRIYFDSESAQYSHGLVLLLMLRLRPGAESGTGIVLTPHDTQSTAHTMEILRKLMLGVATECNEITLEISRNAFCEPTVRNDQYALKMSRSDRTHTQSSTDPKSIQQFAQLHFRLDNTVTARHYHVGYVMLSLDARKPRYLPEDELSALSSILRTFSNCDTGVNVFVNFVMPAGSGAGPNSLQLQVADRIRKGMEAQQAAGLLALQYKSVEVVFAELALTGLRRTASLPSTPVSLPPYSPPVDTEDKEGRDKFPKPFYMPDDLKYTPRALPIRQEVLPRHKSKLGKWVVKWRDILR